MICEDDKGIISGVAGPLVLDGRPYPVTFPGGLVAGPGSHIQGCFLVYSHPAPTLPSPCTPKPRYFFHMSELRGCLVFRMTLQRVSFLLSLSHVGFEE